VLFYSVAVAGKKQDKGELQHVTKWPVLAEKLESGLVFSTMLFWLDHINWFMW